jgi:predicted translin family RNA/ssDNA-binding protein
MNRDQLDQITDLIRNNFEDVNDARDNAYEQSRRLISVCAKSIRAIHRE